MALKPLTERLDELSSADQEAEQVLPEQIKLDELIPLTDSGQEFEPTLVAGPASLFKRALKNAPKRTERPVIPKEVDSAEVGPYQMIREADVKTGEAILEAAPTMPTTGKPSLTQAEIDAGVPKTAFNLDQITDEDGVKQFIEATARQYGADKIERVSYKEIAAKAAEEGYDEAFLNRLINPNAVTEASASSAYKMLLAINDAGKRAFDLGEQVKAAKDAGTLNAELASQFQQAVALEGVLLKAARGRQADIARTLGIFSQARQTTANRGAMLDAIMTESGGIESVHDFANKYISLSNKGARANLAENGYGNSFWGVANRMKDMVLTTWINGILSGPVTSAKNIASNVFFGGLQVPERALASAIGKTRNFMFPGGEEAISGNELYAQAIGILQGIREGGVIAGKAFVNNAPTDPFQKIESGRINKNPFDWDMGDSDFGKAMSLALRYWGEFVTLPGRALMAQDEFFKGVGYRMELNALSARESDKMYSSLIKSNVDPDNASKQSAELLSELLSNPTADLDEAAKSFSRMITFTRELEPALQTIQRAAQNPLIKTFIPFMRTPTNITLEAMARTPGLNFGTPRFWGDFNAGGIRRDQALARVTLGGAMIYSVAAGVFEGGFTGYGPMRMEDKKALEGTGWQPFSRVFDLKDVDEELISKFEKLTTVSRGPDKIYVSYAGLEPVGTLLGIGATMGEYAQMTPGGDDLDKLMMGGALGIYEYLGDTPMLQGFSDMQKVVTSGAKDAPTFFYNIIEQASKQFSDVLIGGSPVGVHSSLVATIERIVDPTKSNTMPSEMGTKQGLLQPAVRGWYEALNRYKSRNPLTSDSLPRSLDPITGEVETVGKGKLYEAFNPFKISDGSYNQAKAVLVAYGVPMYIPDKSIDGIQLSATQYNRWIELATQDGLLAQRVAMLGESPAMQSLASNDLTKAQAIISKEISDAYSEAKQRLIAEDPDLQDAMLEIQEYRRDYGKYKR
jgi:hypothetical protein